MAKKAFLLFLVLLGLFPAGPAFADQMVSKTVCVSSFGMGWNTSEEAKSYLVVLAKREAVGELFGELISSLTNVENFELAKDSISATSMGFVRIKGDPAFFNQGFGEVCVTVQAYVTDEDLNRFQPHEVSKKVCVSDPDLPLRDVRRIAEDRARIHAVRDFAPGLGPVDDEVVLGLLHESSTEAAGFIPETTVYCVTARGVVYPVELLAAMNDKANRVIRIISVAYGINGKYCDATHFFQERCDGRADCSVEISNRMCGDPLVGFLKEAVITYQCGSRSKTIRVAEGAKAHLSCP